MKARFTVEDVPAAPADDTTPPPADDAPGVQVWRVGGEIDTTNAADFEALVAARSPGGGLVLDLSDVLYCDSAAFAALDRILSKGDAAVVLGPGNPVRRAAAIMGLAVHESVEGAAQALQR